MDLARRIDAELASAPPGELVDSLSFDEGDRPGAAMRAALREGARTGRTCRIRYLKPTDPAASRRELDPY